MLWKNHKIKKATWKKKQTIWKNYPELFLMDFGVRIPLMRERIVTPMVHLKDDIVILYELAQV